MARFRIKVGTTEVESEGTKAFVRACMPDLLKFVKGSGLSAEGVALRDDALASIGGLESDLESLVTQHQMIGDLNQRLSTAVRSFGEDVERFFREVLNNAALTGAQAGAAAGGDSSAHLLNATKQMQETQMSFNLQYLQLQSQMQHENRSYTAISNIMKTKHDTVKNSISNIR